MVDPGDGIEEPFGIGEGIFSHETQRLHQEEAIALLQEALQFNVSGGGGGRGRKRRRKKGEQGSD